MTAAASIFAPQIAPLVWEPHFSDGRIVVEGQNGQRRFLTRARLPWGPSYYVMEKEGLFTLEDDPAVFFGTEDEARKAAERKYESIVLAAFMPSAEPVVVFDWKQVDDRRWEADVAEGWKAIVTHGLGDGKWSFVAPRSGRCFLESREIAIAMAEDWMRKKISHAFDEARTVMSAFAFASGEPAHD